MVLDSSAAATGISSAGQGREEAVAPVKYSADESASGKRRGSPLAGDVAVLDDWKTAKAVDNHTGMHTFTDNRKNNQRLDIANAVVISTQE